MEADALASRDPLPGVTEIRQVLREVPTAEHALRLSDHDLVLLAAAASASAAATPRLELYPRNLPAERAVKISQVGSIAEGAFADELVRRVLARFPDLDEPNRPTPDTITEAAEEPRLRRRQGIGLPAPPLVVHPGLGDIRLAQPHSRPPDTVNRHRRGGRARRGPADPGPPARRLHRAEGPDPRRGRHPPHGCRARRRHRRQRHDRVRPHPPRGRRRAGPSQVGDRPGRRLPGRLADRQERLRRTPGRDLDPP